MMVILEIVHFITEYLLENMLENMLMLDVTNDYVNKCSKRYMKSCSYRAHRYFNAALFTESSFKDVREKYWERLLSP